MEENFDRQSQPSIMVPLEDMDKVEQNDNDVDVLAQELATIRQSAKKNRYYWFKKFNNYTSTNYRNINYKSCYAR